MCLVEPFFNLLRLIALQLAGILRDRDSRYCWMETFYVVICKVLFYSLLDVSKFAVNQWAREDAWKNDSHSAAKLYMNYVQAAGLCPPKILCCFSRWIGCSCHCFVRIVFFFLFVWFLWNDQTSQEMVFSIFVRVNETMNCLFCEWLSLLLVERRVNTVARLPNFRGHPVEKVSTCLEYN